MPQDITGIATKTRTSTLFKFMLGGAVVLAAGLAFLNVKQFTRSSTIASASGASGGGGACSCSVCPNTPQTGVDFSYWSDTYYTWDISQEEWRTSRKDEGASPDLSSYNFYCDGATVPIDIFATCSASIIRFNNGVPRCKCDEYNFTCNQSSSGSGSGRVSGASDQVRNYLQQRRAEAERFLK